MDAHVGKKYSQEGPGKVSSQDCARHTRATRQCEGSHVHHGVVSLGGFGLERISKDRLHNR
jgi:hypothetical protein